MDVITYHAPSATRRDCKRKVEPRLTRIDERQAKAASRNANGPAAQATGPFVCPCRENQKVMRTPPE